MSDDDSDLEQEFDEQSNSGSEEIDELEDFSDDEDSDDEEEIPEVSDPEGGSGSDSDDESNNESEEDDEEEDDSDLEELEESDEEEAEFLKKQTVPKRQPPKETPSQKTSSRPQRPTSPERSKPSTRVEPVKSASKFDVPKASTARRTVAPSDVQKIAEQLRGVSPSYRRKSQRKVPANSYVDPIRKEIKGAYPNLSETEAEALAQALLAQVKYGVVYDGMSNAVLRDIKNRVSARLD